MTQSIKGLSIDQLEELIQEIGQPRYRAKQVYEWLHTHNASSYDEMTNVPKTLRAALAEKYPMKAPEVKEVLKSKDGTLKLLIAFPDGAVTETVAIPDSGKGDNDRVTVCVSSQAGCAMECIFCATGNQGFTRNLSTDEIVAQVVLAGKEINQRVDNVVFMGQGEPFLNYENVAMALERLNKDKGLGIGARHITVSTSGIVDGIYDFSEEPEQFRLAVSLHSADQATRNKLMPRLSGQPLHSLKKALAYYCDTKGRRITVEYMLLDGINDSDEQIDKLVEFCKGLNSHVNILEFNKIKGSNLKPASKKRIQEWLDILQEKGITASLRRSKGGDVAGACGQLAGEASINE